MLPPRIPKEMRWLRFTVYNGAPLVARTEVIPGGQKLVIEHDPAHWEKRGVDFNRWIAKPENWEHVISQAIAESWLLTDFEWSVKKNTLRAVLDEFKKLIHPQMCPKLGEAGAWFAVLMGEPMVIIEMVRCGNIAASSVYKALKSFEREYKSYPSGVFGRP